MIVYTIMGTPVSIVKQSQSARKVLDEFNLNRLNQQQQLRNQHNDKPLLNGLYDLDVEFYFDREFVKSRGYASNKPAISSLLKYLDDIMRGIVYQNEYIVTHVNASKYYECPEAKTIIRFSKRMPQKERHGINKNS